MTDQFLLFQLQMNSYSRNWKWTATAAIGIHPTDCHSWWISKMKSRREDTLEEWYAIKFCFKLGKMSKKTYGICHTAFGASCMNWASVFEWHKRLKEGRKAGSLWGMMRGVGGVRKSEHQTHTTNITLLRIKCERLYFYKEVCSFVHWSSYIMFDYVSSYICNTAIQQGYWSSNSINTSL